MLSFIFFFARSSGAAMAESATSRFLFLFLSVRLFSAETRADDTASLPSLLRSKLSTSLVNSFVLTSLDDVSAAVN